MSGEPDIVWAQAVDDAIEALGAGVTIEQAHALALEYSNHTVLAALVRRLNGEAGGGGGTDDQTAVEVPFTPAGGLSSTDVQGALVELDGEKAATSHAHAGEDITSGTVADARIASTIARDSEVTSALAALTAADIDLADSGGFYSATDVEAALAEIVQGAFEFVVDGGGSAITTGIKGDLEVPFDCTIVSARTLADQSGSVVLDVWKDTYANYPPTNVDTITASAKPTLSSAAKAEDTTLTGWTKTLTKGEVLRLNVDSASTVTRVLLSLGVTRR